MENIIVRIYNSSERLVFEGDYAGYQEMKNNYLINSSDRISFIERNNND